MNEIAKNENKGVSLSMEKQVEQKKNQIATVLNSAILSQFGYTENSNSTEATKKKQEVSMFLSKLVDTKTPSGSPAILTCTPDSIKECCMIYCNNELNFFKSQAYLFPYGNKMSFMISKDGYVSMAKSLDPNIDDFYYDVVYKKDIFEYSKVAGKTIITKHMPKLENITCKIEDILCAYATCVYKDGSHIADVMTVEEIQNALKTAKKTFTDTHKTNPKVMLGKFPLRRLAKTKINQGINQETRDSLRFEDDSENVINVNNKTQPNMEVVIDTEQNYKAPQEKNVDDIIAETMEETPIEIIEQTEEDWNEEDMQQAMSVEEVGETKIVYYSVWLKELKDSGEWEQIKDYNEDGFKNGYNPTDKKVIIRRI